MSKKKKNSKAEYFTFNGMWLDCPHCKKLIIASEAPVIKVLKRWKKQK